MAQHDDLPRFRPAAPPGTRRRATGPARRSAQDQNHQLPDAATPARPHHPVLPPTRVQPASSATPAPPRRAAGRPLDVSPSSGARPRVPSAGQPTAAPRRAGGGPRAYSPTPPAERQGWAGQAASGNAWPDPNSP
ncbi:MAG: hypothetical protein LBK95_13080, partial [Bifidobacteriaceae bacterium]|nr:hypothetical protein [Bifidobacteriaceae bacterium]